MEYKEILDIFKYVPEGVKCFFEGVGEVTFKELDVDGNIVVTDGNEEFAIGESDAAKLYPCERIKKWAAFTPIEVFMLGRESAWTATTERITSVKYDGMLYKMDGSDPVKLTQEPVAKPVVAKPAAPKETTRVYNANPQRTSAPKAKKTKRAVEPPADVKTVYSFGCSENPNGLHEALIRHGGVALEPMNYTLSDTVYYIDTQDGNKIKTTSKDTMLGMMIVSNFSDLCVPNECPIKIVVNGQQVPSERVLEILNEYSGLREDLMKIFE